MRIFFAAAFLVFLLSDPAIAARGKVEVDLASDHVDITTGFNGTTLGLFGVKREEGEVAVIVRGPLRTMSVRRKESVFGAWINKKSEKFKAVPTYYNYALSAPLDKIAGPEVLRRYGIGPGNLQFNKPDSRDETRMVFREAMIRNKQKQGLFADEAGVIHFLGADFFRADFHIPANVPVGEYEVQTLYFSGGELKEEINRVVRVAHVGFAAGIYEFAHERSFLYGVFCVALAIFAGWFSNRVRRG